MYEKSKGNSLKCQRWRLGLYTLYIIMSYIMKIFDFLGKKCRYRKISGALLSQHFFYLAKIHFSVPQGEFYIVFWGVEQILFNENF